MLNFTRLAAIAFDDNEKSYRVYYQDSTNLIRESCYDDTNGWYTRDGSIVATNAKKGTSLAATCWGGGKDIRVYYMSDDNNLIEAKWSVNNSSDIGSWESSIDLKSTKPEPQTQLAVVCTETDNGDFRVQLIYQSTNQELRQTSFNSNEQGGWEDAVLNSGTGTIKIPRGNGLAATTTGNTRIFYQGSNREIYMLKESGHNWKAKKLEKIAIADKTPIVAAAASLTNDSDDESQINLCFVGNDKKLLPKVYNPKDDKFVEGQPSQAPTEVVRNNSLAVATPADGETCIFFPSVGPSGQPMISQYNLEGATKFPLGIPTTRPGNPEAPRVRPVKPSSNFEEMGRLGLVRRQAIDSMDEATKKEFIERLKSTVKTVIAQSMGSNGFPTDKSQSAIDELSRDFRLGFGWEGKGGLWKGRDVNESWAVTYNQTNLQLRLEGAMGYVGLVCGPDSGQLRLNTYLYLDTLYRLCRYLKVESE